MKRKESAEAIEGRYRTPEDGCANNKERRSRCIRVTSNVIRKPHKGLLAGGSGGVARNRKSVELVTGTRSAPSEHPD